MIDTRNYFLNMAIGVDKDEVEKLSELDFFVSWLALVAQAICLYCKQ